MKKTDQENRKTGSGTEAEAESEESRKTGIETEAEAPKPQSENGALRSDLDALALAVRGIEILRKLTGQAKSPEYIEWERDVERIGNS